MPVDALESYVTDAGMNGQGVISDTSHQRQLQSNDPPLYVLCLPTHRYPGPRTLNM